MLPPAENDVPPFAHEPAPPVMQPRLGIVHLMAWVFFSCLWLAMHRSAGSSLDMWPENFRAVMFVASIVQAIIAGAALGGVALWLWRLYRGGPRFPDQPGHYLLWVNGVVVAASIPISMLIQAFSSPSLILVLGLSTLQGAALALIAMIPLAAAQAWRWRAFWLAVALVAVVRVMNDLLFAWMASTGSASTFLEAALQLLTSMVGGAVYLVLIGAVVFEIRARGNMDWLSWAGVSLWLASGLSAIVFAVLIGLLS